MRQLSLLLVFYFVGLNLVSGSGLTACSTPGFHLSSDQNYCFAYNTQYKTAPHHSVMCKSYGAKLLTVESAAKEALVVTYLTDKGLISTKQVYFGLTNIIGGGNNWAWYNLQGSINYTNWADGNPVTTNRYNCVGFTAGTPDTKWTNDLCLRDKNAICEREATAADLP